MTDREILEKILVKVDSLEDEFKTLKYNQKGIDLKLDKTDGQVRQVRILSEEIGSDVKHIKKQVDTLYEWVDGIDIDVKNVKDAVYNKA